MEYENNTENASNMEKLPDQSIPTVNNNNLVRCSNIIIISDDEEQSVISDGESVELETRSIISGCTSIGEALKTINIVDDSSENDAIFPQSIRVGIIPNVECQQPMRYPQIKQIQEAVLDVAEEQLSQMTENCVQFLGCQGGIGFLIMICSSEVTANWLKMNIDKVAAKCGYGLKVVDEADFPKSQIVHGYFRQSAEYSNEKILKRIEVSNKNLMTRYWNVLRRTQRGQAVQLLISIDDHSASQIRKDDGYIFYRFGQIRLNFGNTYRNKFGNKPRCLTMARSKQAITYNRSLNVSSQNVSDWLVCTEKCNTQNIKRKKTTHVANMPYNVYINPWEHQVNASK